MTIAKKELLSVAWTKCATHWKYNILKLIKINQEFTSPEKFNMHYGKSHDIE